MEQHTSSALALTEVGIVLGLLLTCSSMSSCLQPPQTSRGNADLQTATDCMPPQNDRAPDVPAAGLTVLPGKSASRAPPQVHGWLAVSDEPECAALQPGAVPARLTWDGESKSCDGLAVDGQGDLTLLSYPHGAAAVQALFFGADGSNAGVVTAARAVPESASTEMVLYDEPRPEGFFLMSLSFDGQGGRSYLNRSVSPAKGLSMPATTEARNSVSANPAGGYVEKRVLNCGIAEPGNNVLQIRWTDETLRPASDWLTVTSWKTSLNLAWRLLVDQRGEVLVLWFLYPPSTSVADPSAWVFGARWVSSSGRLSEVFEPAAPIYSLLAGSGSFLFADWGNFLALKDGGFAVYREPLAAGSKGTISETGWYAFYAAGVPARQAAPAWLKAYDGSIQLLSTAAGYAAIRRDASTCSRTIDFVGPKGGVCFSVPIDTSDSCSGWTDSLWPDGTLTSQNGCQVRWWPGLAKPSVTLR
jgi:hypothetical protein